MLASSAIDCDGGCDVWGQAGFGMVPFCGGGRTAARGRRDGTALGMLDIDVS